MQFSEEEIIFKSENKKNCPAIIFKDVNLPKDTIQKGIILAHAWWGINQEIRNHALEYAALGNYKIIVPDFYRGKVATNREDAGHYMADLDWRGALKDLQGAVLYLLNEENCSHVGVIGFCMGGALSFLCAGEQVHGLSLAVSFYGIPRKQFTDMTNTRIPIQGHFAINDTVDGLSSPKDFLALYEDFKSCGKPHLELNIYPTDHGFMHPTYASYDKEQAKVAIQRLKIFLNTHLK